MSTNIKSEKPEKINTNSIYKILHHDNFINKTTEANFTERTIDDLKTNSDNHKKKEKKTVTFKKLVKNVVYIENWKEFNVIQDKNVSDCNCNCLFV